MTRAAHGTAMIHDGRGVLATAVMLACLLVAGFVMAQSAAPVPHIPGMAMPAAEPTPPPFYREWTFHVLIGLIAATGGPRPPRLVATALAASARGRGAGGRARGGPRRLASTLRARIARLPP